MVVCRGINYNMCIPNRYQKHWQGLLERTQGNSLRNGLKLDRLTARQLCNHVCKHLQGNFKLSHVHSTAR